MARARGGRGEGRPCTCGRGPREEVGRLHAVGMWVARRYGRRPAATVRCEVMKDLGRSATPSAAHGRVERPRVVSCSRWRGEAGLGIKCAGAPPVPHGGAEEGAINPRPQAETCDGRGAGKPKPAGPQHVLAATTTPSDETTTDEGVAEGKRRAQKKKKRRLVRSRGSRPSTSSGRARRQAQSRSFLSRFSRGSRARRPAKAKNVPEEGRRRTPYRDVDDTAFDDTTLDTGV